MVIPPPPHTHPFSTYAHNKRLSLVSNSSPCALILTSTKSILPYTTKWVWQNRKLVFSLSRTEDNLVMNAKIHLRVTSDNIFPPFAYTLSPTPHVFNALPNETQYPIYHQPLHPLPHDSNIHFINSLYAFAVTIQSENLINKYFLIH